jgi:DNA invertase Pin-like site-specific DNA recombinase
LVWAFDRNGPLGKALSRRKEFNRLNIAFISSGENVDTDSALGRVMLIIIAAISELERSLIVERVSREFIGRNSKVGKLFGHDWISIGSRLSRIDVAGCR